ncbi:aminomethyltransferase family protein [Streptomyces chartreusis]|uniref:Aminomethyl transferase family protein n=1 Tax=Streptomyces chartreusis TaxID=1969 RepID=A0A7H8TCT3_STRCX|nr:aminomethyltransferase family protein [Streptomyces chartreusis]QKZ20838.1 aminomethyl transferase family protein [Streptomyces chartreusis]
MVLPEGLRSTPFAPRYADRVEEWIDVYGHAVPLFISDPAEEYEAIRTRAGASEYSMLYKWHVEGDDAVVAVDAVFSRSVRGLGAGRITYGVVVDAEGMMVDDVTVAVLAPDHVVVTGGNPATQESLATHAPAGTTVTERREESAVLTLQGPCSRDVLRRLTQVDVSNTAFPYYTFLQSTLVAGIEAQVSRIGFTAELGYEIQVPRERALELWDAVLEAGADLGVQAFGAAALMMCRTEAAMIMGELEYDHTVTPFECRMGWAVDFEKGPFQGRDALLAKKDAATGRVVSVVVDARPEVAEGARLELDGRDIGYVTMAVPSPALAGATLGLARVHRDAVKSGTALTAVIADGSKADATVRPTPVYDPERARVRA